MENANILLMKQMKGNNDKTGTLKLKSSKREQGCPWLLLPTTNRTVARIPPASKHLKANR